MHRSFKRLAGTAAALAALAFSLIPVQAAAASVPADSTPTPRWDGGFGPSFPWLPPGGAPGYPWLPPGGGNPWQPPGGGNPPPQNPPPNNPPPQNPPPQTPPGGGSNATEGFPAQFQAPVNAQTGQSVTGWGCDFTGQTDGGAVQHTPVLFVHGATRDAHDFDQDRQYFLSQGYSPCELWAVSYGYGSVQNPETNTASAPTVKAFVHAMLDYLKKYKNPNVTQIDIVTHSLGGTVVRKWLADSGETNLVRSFVPIAAPNHGISICPSPSAGPQVCQEIAAGSQWLAALNSKGEAPKGVRTMTIYDGTGQYDPMYSGSLMESPALKGATNHPYNKEHSTRFDHEGLINGTAALQFQWLQNDYVPTKH